MAEKWMPIPLTLYENRRDSVSGFEDKRPSICVAGALYNSHGRFASVLAATEAAMAANLMGFYCSNGIIYGIFDIDPMVLLEKCNGLCPFVNK